MESLNRKEPPMNKLSKLLSDSIRKPVAPPSKAHRPVKGKGSYRRAPIKSWSENS